MADRSAIEWTDATWNPVTGCTRVSAGCAHCYIETTVPFRTKRRRFERVGNEETTGIQLHPERLGQPLRWKQPRMIFVCSLSDLFHEEIPYEFVREVFNVMRRCTGYTVAATGKANPSHTFQVLTKRPERALDLWRDRKLGFTDWPENVWMGVSIENARYTWRADVLREIPAAVRFISAEPLLGSLYPGMYEKRTFRGPLDLTGIDWVIGGGESGGRFARPMHPDWAREIRDACLRTPTAQELADFRSSAVARQRAYEADAYRPAFFFKQWGSWAPGSIPGKPSRFVAADGFTSDDIWTDPGLAEDRRLDGKTDRWRSLVWMGYRGASPKSGGRELDGREWNEMPVAQAVAA